MKDLLKRIQKIFKQKKGFTLIELLVVIGILGVLAAALIATIDPFEQIKKAQDSNTKNAAVEFNDALLRYYATHNAFPWDANGDAACAASVTGVPDAVVLWNAAGSPQLSPCVTALTKENELKSAFGTDTNDLQNIYVTFDNGTGVNDTIVCFQPQSMSQEKVALLTADGKTGGTHTCVFHSGVPADTAAGCFWCTQTHSS